MYVIPLAWPSPLFDPPSPALCLPADHGADQNPLLPERSQSPPQPQLEHQPLPAICIGVRVYEGIGTSWLTVLLKGLLVQHQKSKFSQQIEMKIFIVNTDRMSSAPSSASSTGSTSPLYEQQLRSLVDELNEEYGGGNQKDSSKGKSKNQRIQRRSDPVSFLLDQRRSSPRQHKNPFYGYDETDKLLDHLLLTSQVSPPISLSLMCRPQV
jgi:hypothetical protein